MSVRFAGLLFALIPLPAFAQPAPPQALQHGVRANAGLQITNLFEPGSTIACAVAGAVSAGGRLFIANPGVYGSGSVVVSPEGGLTAPSRDSSIVCAQFDTWIEQLPSDYAESVVGFLDVERGASKATIQRYVRDNLRQVYISYAITVEKLAEASAYRVTFGDAGAPAPKDLWPQGKWKIVSPARYPVPQIVRDGDEVRLLLYANPGGVELADYLHVGLPDKMPKRKSAAHDVYASDAEFMLAMPTLSINGVAQPLEPLAGGIHGPELWIYAPGYGRYVLAFAPRSGLERAGETAGNLITLSIGGDILRIRSADRIAAGDGVYNVYGTQDASWQPPDPGDRERFMMGVLPTIEPTLER